MNGYADIFYVPKSDMEDVMYFFNLFYKNKVFLEIAVPLTLSAVAGKERITELIAQQGYYKLRGNLFAYYNKTNH